MVLKIKTRLSLVIPDRLGRPASMGEMRISPGEE